jgi:hypothetical protein
MKEYQKTDKYRQYRKKYVESEKYKERKRRDSKDYYQKNKQHYKDYYQKMKLKKLSPFSEAS